MSHCRHSLRRCSHAQQKKRTWCRLNSLTTHIPMLDQHKNTFQSVFLHLNAARGSRQTPLAQSSERQGSVGMKTCSHAFLDPVWQHPWGATGLYEVTGSKSWVETLTAGMGGHICCLPTLLANFYSSTTRLKCLQGRTHIVGPQLLCTVTISIFSCWVS